MFLFLQGAIFSIPDRRCFYLARSDIFNSRSAVFLFLRGVVLSLSADRQLNSRSVMLLFFVKTSILKCRAKIAMCKKKFVKKIFYRPTDRPVFFRQKRVGGTVTRNIFTGGLSRCLMPWFNYLPNFMT